MGFEGVVVWGRYGVLAESEAFGVCPRIEGEGEEERGSGVRRDPRCGLGRRTSEVEV